MGRTPVNMAVNKEILRGLLESLGPLSERAEKYGVTKQAINGWLNTGLIPPRALSELVMELGIDAETVKSLLEVGERKQKGKRRRYTFTLHVDEYGDEP